MGTIRVAIVGVGNCAASLVQGVEYYKDADPESSVPGLMHVQFGDYHVGDIEFVAAFDVDAKKVGQDLAHAILASENNTIKIADVPPTGITVQRGHTLDGLGKYYRETITESDEEPVDVVARAARRRVPTSWSATCPSGPRTPPSSTPRRPSTPVSASSTPCRSSSPAPRSGPRSSRTPVFRSSATTSRARSAPPSRTECSRSCSRTVASSLDRTYQLNVGGNMDFKNMLERERLESKKISKTQSVTSQMKPRHRQGQRAHRPQRLRRVAR